jgi:NhaA family Na+:H+ antiporter
MLPAIAAAGGMIVPAAFYLAFNHDGPGRPGWGIPMATDIAFCIGILTLLRSRVPHALAVFVTALAIFDDIGGILVIAFFYGSGVHASWLLATAGVAAVLVLMNRFHVLGGFWWALGGAALWYALHHAGIHATIAGVVLGLAIPSRPRRPLSEVLRELARHTDELARTCGDEALDAEAVLSIEDRLEDLEAPLARFEHFLHPWVAYGVMPVFALANSGVDLGGLDRSQLLGDIAVGTALALFLGKMLGIFAFTWAAVRLGVSRTPGGASMTKVFGVSIVAGVGFTVALFIAGLAFPGAPELLEQAKVGILAGSLAAGVAGAIVLRLTSRVPGAEAPSVDPAQEKRVTAR